MVPFWFFTTQSLQGVAGLSPVEAGLAFPPPMTITDLAAALVIPWLPHRYAGALLLAASLLVVLVALVRSSTTGRTRSTTPRRADTATPPSPPRA